jgi:hypothetical protein
VGRGRTFKGKGKGKGRGKRGTGIRSWTRSALVHRFTILYDVLMRTTLDLDDAVLEAARTAARSTRRSIGAVISEWARRGVSAAPRERNARADGRGRVPTFDVRRGAPLIDIAVIKELLDDEGLPP